MSEESRPRQLADWMVEHMEAYLATNGEDGHVWRGVQTLLLTTTGRRTGRSLMLPLIYGAHGDHYVIVASKGGYPQHPGWYVNLVAEPAVQVQMGAERFTARARTASGDERVALWNQMADIWPPYNEYQAKTEREIPVVVLERGSDDADGKEDAKVVELPVFSVDLHEAARRSESEASEWIPEQLDEAIGRYRKFFHLASFGPGVAPTREIDMIWHLHMQAPVAYYRDCMRYLGRILDHDGGFGKTPEEAVVLGQVFAKTAERWQQVFGEPYVAAEEGTKCWHDCQDRCWHACAEMIAAQGLVGATKQ